MIFNHPIVLRKYFDESRQENRYQVQWQNNKEVIIDSAHAGDLVHFLLGLCESDSHELSTIDDSRK